MPPSEVRRDTDRRQFMCHGAAARPLQCGSARLASFSCSSAACVLGCGTALASPSPGSEREMTQENRLHKRRQMKRRQLSYCRARGAASQQAVSRSLLYKAVAGSSKTRSSAEAIIQRHGKGRGLTMGAAARLYTMTIGDRQIAAPVRGDILNPADEPLVGGSPTSTASHLQNVVGATAATQPPFAARNRAERRAPRGLRGDCPHSERRCTRARRVRDPGGAQDADGVGIGIRAGSVRRQGALRCVARFATQGHRCLSRRAH